MWVESVVDTRLLNGSRPVQRDTGENVAPAGQTQEEPKTRAESRARADKHWKATSRRNASLQRRDPADRMQECVCRHGLENNCGCIHLLGQAACLFVVLETQQNK